MEFNPRHGDIIVTNNGNQYTCTNKKEVAKFMNSSTFSMAEHAMYGYRKLNNGQFSWMGWDNSGIPPSYNDDFSIKKIIRMNKIRMNKTQPHKHAELIKAWADGASIQRQSYRGDWMDIDNAPLWDNNAEYRIKPEEPKFIEVNGVKIPEPYRVHPGKETIYWVPVLHDNHKVKVSMWHSDKYDLSHFKNGLCFKTKEDAEAFTNAVLNLTKV